MEIRSASSRFIAKVTSTVVAAVMAFVLLPGQGQALGNNRVVSRDCGKNYVASGASSSKSAWAQTTRVSGTCSGRLSAGLQANDGFVFPRSYGTRERAYVSETYSFGFSRGMHWGCDNCNVTYS
jgi:hypothetical protein